MFKLDPRMDMSLEAINFQDGKLGKALEATILSMMEQNMPNVAIVNNSSFMSELEKVVKEYTGLTITFRAWNSGSACFLYKINPSNILIEPDLNKHDVDHLLTKIKTHGDKGRVDLNKGKVDGLYAGVDFCIYLSRGIVVKNYTAVPEEGLIPDESAFTIEEIVAIILHEIGHAFGIIEYNNRAVLANLALSAIVKNADNPNEKERVDVVKFISTEILGDPKALKDLENETIGTASGVIFLTKFGKALKSSTNSAFYDVVGGEAVADVFVSRQGYGKHLVRALRKIENISKLYGAGEETTKLGNLTGGLAKSLLMTARFGLVGVNVLFGIPLIGAALFVVTFASFYVQTTSYKLDLAGDMTYDNIKTRIQRIREDTIQAIKNKDLDKETTQMFADNIRDMKRIEDGITIEKDFYQKAIDFMFQSKGGKEDIMKLHRNLEELASNDLFLQAARLRTL